MLPKAGVNQTLCHANLPVAPMPQHVEKHIIHRPHAGAEGASRGPPHTREPPSRLVSPGWPCAVAVASHCQLRQRQLAAADAESQTNAVCSEHEVIAPRPPAIVGAVSRASRPVPTAAMRTARVVRPCRLLAHLPDVAAGAAPAGGRAARLVRCGCDGGWPSTTSRADDGPPLRPTLIGGHSLWVEQRPNGWSTSERQETTWFLLTPFSATASVVPSQPCR